MIRNFTLTAITTILFSAISVAQNTYVDNGSATAYSLNNGDSLYIAGGTFTGSVNSFNSGAKITVASGAAFQPQTFSNPKGTIYIYGTARLLNGLNSNNDFKVNNYGALWVSGDAQLNGNGQLWQNQLGATLKFDNNVTVNNSNSIVSNGTITIGGNFTLNSNASLTNNHTIAIGGSFIANGATINNNSLLQSSGSLTFNSNAAISNACTLIAGTGITNNSNNITNSGLIWAQMTGNPSNSFITNNGKITNSANAKVKSVSFTNNGTLAGSGYYYFTGATTNYGTTGVNGNTADTIRIYDVSRTNAPKIFDTQWGTVHPNTVYAVFAAPDTTIANITCSQSNIPLPVKWNYFYVNIADNTPVIKWSANQDPGTVFEVQRSYNGTDFYTIQSVAEENKTVFTYDDRQVNTQATVVYYRIKATEPTGTVVFSETRAAKFSNKNGISVQLAPNPFTSQISINYQSPARETITVKIYSLNGQVHLTKTVQVSNGYNTITLPGLASLPKGMYVATISNGATIIANQKIVKQ